MSTKQKRDAITLLVRVRQVRYVDVEVPASCVDDLYTVPSISQQAIAAATESTEPFRFSVDPVRQVAGPWLVKGRCGWYDPHARDVIAFKRAYGNEFTQADVDLLRARVERLGLTVVDAWNGAGCNTLSIRAEGRRDGGKAEFIEDELAALLAEREETCRG